MIDASHILGATAGQPTLTQFSPKAPQPPEECHQNTMAIMPPNKRLNPRRHIQVIDLQEIPRGLPRPGTEHR